MLRRIFSLCLIGFALYFVSQPLIEVWSDQRDMHDLQFSIHTNYLIGLLLIARNHHHLKIYVSTAFADERTYIHLYVFYAVFALWRFFFYDNPLAIKLIYTWSITYPIIPYILNDKFKQKESENTETQDT